MEELLKTDDEILHYEKYMQSKTVREQSKIQQLNEQNIEELQRLKAQKQINDEAFVRQKAGKRYSVVSFIKFYIFPCRLSNILNMIYVAIALQIFYFCFFPLAMFLVLAVVFFKSAIYY